MIGSKLLFIRFDSIYSCEFLMYEQIVFGSQRPRSIPWMRRTQSRLTSYFLSRSLSVSESDSLFFSLWKTTLPESSLYPVHGLRLLEPNFGAARQAAAQPLKLLRICCIADRGFSLDGYFDLI